MLLTADVHLLAFCTPGSMWPYMKITDCLLKMALTNVKDYQPCRTSPLRSTLPGLDPIEIKLV